MFSQQHFNMVVDFGLHILWCMMPICCYYMYMICIEYGGCVKGIKIFSIKIQPGPIINLEGLCATCSFHFLLFDVLI